MKVNCPNCGAPFKGTSCEYCGTRLEDIFAVKAGEPVMLSWMYNGMKMTFKMNPTKFTLAPVMHSDHLFADDAVYKTLTSYVQTEVVLEGTLEPFEWHDRGGVLLLKEGDIPNGRA